MLGCFLFRAFSSPLRALPLHGDLFPRASCGARCVLPRPCVFLSASCCEARRVPRRPCVLPPPSHAAPPPGAARGFFLRLASPSSFALASDRPSCRTSPGGEQRSKPPAPPPAWRAAALGVISAMDSAPRSCGGLPLRAISYMLASSALILRSSSSAARASASSSSASCARGTLFSARRSSSSSSRLRSSSFFFFGLFPLLPRVAALGALFVGLALFLLALLATRLFLSSSRLRARRAPLGLALLLLQPLRSSSSSLRARLGFLLPLRSALPRPRSSRGAASDLRSRFDFSASSRTRLDSASALAFASHGGAHRGVAAALILPLPPRGPLLPSRISPWRPLPP